MSARRQQFTTRDPYGNGVIGGIHWIPEDTREHIVNQECWCQPREDHDKHRWHHFETQDVRKKQWNGWKIDG